MPRITQFDGIKIEVYGRDHNPPHFHAIYAEHEALITIKTREVIEGHLPSKQLKEAKEYGVENEAILLEKFIKLNPRLK